MDPIYDNMDAQVDMRIRGNDDFFDLLEKTCCIFSVKKTHTKSLCVSQMKRISYCDIFMTNACDGQWASDQNVVT